MSEISNQEIEENGVNGAGTHQGEGVAPGRQGVPDPAPAGRHHDTGRTSRRRKWEKEVNKIVIECWIRSEPTKRKYGRRMKQIWDEIGVLDVQSKDWLISYEIVRETILQFIFPSSNVIVVGCGTGRWFFSIPQLNQGQFQIA